MKITWMAAAIILAVSAIAAEPSYDSLKDYCLQTGVDTPENCTCGQATADEIMTDEEQQQTLAMMISGQPPPFDSMEAQMAFMEKVGKVTDGCG